MSEDERTKNNAAIGRLQYQVVTDAAGYPNGMAYWADLPPVEKYRVAAEALSLIEMLEKQGFITINKPLGLEGSVWGEGKCKALVDHYESTAAAEIAAFETHAAELTDAAFETDDEGNHKLVSKDGRTIATIKKLNAG